MTNRITPLTARSGTGRREGSGPPNGTTTPPANSATESYYQLLGVAPTAGRAELHRAYRAAMKRIHPDRQRASHRAAAEEAAKRLNHAYATLSNPLTRQTYDRTIQDQRIQDEVMNRYVGGFFVPQMDDRVDPLASHLRRDQTVAERREKSRADRDALVSVGLAFGGAMLAVVTLLLLWAVIQAVASAAF